MDSDKTKSTLVMKFGGASVATPDSFARIAEIILNRMNLYTRIAVVVSAMGDTTDDLISLAHKVNPQPPRRELDMLISVGERISVALLAMALAKEGQDAISFTGSQAGIVTTEAHSEARIVDVRPHRILPHVESGKVLVIAGFQGVSRTGEITTLGRGGSDTTAVALAVALNADKVEFFKDVDGIFDCDPKTNSNAKLKSVLSFEEARELVAQGAQVLHDRSVLLAEKNELPLHVLPFMDFLNTSKGTWIGPRQRPEIPKTYEVG